MGYRFGVSFRNKRIAFFNKFIFNINIILNNSVMNNGYCSVAAYVWVRIYIAWRAMSGPPCMAYAKSAANRRFINFLNKINKLAFRFNNIYVLSVMHGYARRVVTPVLKPFKAVNKYSGGLLISYISNYTAHLFLYLPIYN